MSVLYFFFLLFSNLKQQEFCFSGFFKGAGG